jgi:endonuclease/exonuclease/phosphatase family metal-dependent hydrolase
VLLLRLTLMHGRTIASDADLLVIPGQTANLKLPLKGGQTLHYRIGTSTDEPTRLSLWLEVQTPLGGQPIAALSTHLQLEPGQGVTAGQLATSAGDYELKIAFAREDLPTDKS